MSHQPVLAHLLATKVACVSLTASSIEEPHPSLRLSNAEDLGGRHGAVFVGVGDGDVEGQDLVGVPGISQFFAAADFRQGLVVDLVDGGADRGPDGADQGSR